VAGVWAGAGWAGSGAGGWLLAGCAWACTAASQPSKLPDVWRRIWQPAMALQVLMLPAVSSLLASQLQAVTVAFSCSSDS